VKPDLGAGELVKFLERSCLAIVDLAAPER
jgi:hypothetical protein